MARDNEEDEFGINSDDDADCIAVLDSFDGTTTKKRRASELAPPVAKRMAIDPDVFALATTALKTNFGMNEFRLKQEQVIKRILSGNSAVVVFPTGGGKSLCYQIPGIVFPELDKKLDTRHAIDAGITLVVSPLIALMKDQVDALRGRGIKARTLDSTKTLEEYIETSDMMRNGELNILYCAPERLNNERFVEQMKGVRGGVRLLAVDEAHCISEWGHAFRPDYLKISRFAKEIRAERVICLTATATPRVASDICKAFAIDEAEGLFRTSMYRPNLKLLAESGTTKKELALNLYSFLKANPGPSIVYVTLQKQTEELADSLRAQGFNARAFHAGMQAPAKTELQEQFMRVNNMVIVATIAFGMGIDKANIRNVVHFNIPNSLESYSQEIGRAGRDGLVSNCMFYVCGEDLHLREMFARGDLPSKEGIRGVLNDIFDPTTVGLPIGSEIKENHYEQEREYDIRSTTLKNIYVQLELNHGLIRAGTPIYSKYMFTAKAGYDAYFKSDKSEAAKAIENFAKLKAKWHHFDIDQATSMLRIPRQGIVNKLDEMEQKGVLELKPGGVLNVYKITSSLPTTPAEIERITNEIYTILEQREQDALGRAEEVLDLITGEECFSRSLAEHFGDSLPGGRKECGHCTWCLDHVAIKPQIPPKVKFNNVAFQRILEEVPDRDDARLLTRIAFGITSPRVTALKLSKHQIFGSMDDHAFTELLKAFITECDDSQSFSVLKTVSKAVSKPSPAKNRKINTPYNSKIASTKLQKSGSSCNSRIGSVRKVAPS